MRARRCRTSSACAASAPSARNVRASGGSGPAPCSRTSRRRTAHRHRTLRPHARGATREHARGMIGERGGQRCARRVGRLDRKRRARNADAGHFVGGRRCARVRNVHRLLPVPCTGHKIVQGKAVPGRTGAHRCVPANTAQRPPHASQRAGRAGRRIARRAKRRRAACPARIGTGFRASRRRRCARTAVPVRTGRRRAAALGDWRPSGADGRRRRRERRKFRSACTTLPSTTVSTDDSCGMRAMSIVK